MVGAAGSLVIEDVVMRLDEMQEKMDAMPEYATHLQSLSDAIRFRFHLHPCSLVLQTTHQLPSSHARWRDRHGQDYPLARSGWKATG